MTRALVLYSGSMASAAAVRLAQLSGKLELRLLHLQSPFFRGSEEVKDKASCMFPDLCLKCQTLKRDYLRMPSLSELLPFPCGVCRYVLLSKAARTARRMRADVVITGDIVGNGGLGDEELTELDRSVGLEGRVLRPLSARLLPPTLAEDAGWVGSEGLLDLSADGGERDGMDRLASLASDLGVGDETRGSGTHCSLRDRVFAERVEGLLGSGPLTVNNLQLLEFEYYYHIPPDLQVVVACGRAEQSHLQGLFLPSDVRMYLLVPRSPLALLRADWSGRRGESLAKALAVGARLALEAAGLSPHSQTVCFRLECEDETHRLSLARPAERTGRAEGGLQSAAAGVSLPRLSSASF